MSNDNDGWCGPREDIHRDGAPEGNQNAAKHSLFSNREYLRENLDDWEQELFMEIVTDLIDRLNGDVAAYEREAIHNIALDTIKRNRANKHLTENFDLQNERAFNSYSKLMRDTTKEMKELGLNVKAPEAKEADAKKSWFDAVAEAEANGEDVPRHRGYNPDNYEEEEQCPVDGCSFVNGNFYKHYARKHQDRDYEEDRDDE